MPHVIVKLLSGRTEQGKARIAEEVTKAVMATTGNGEDAVSVAIEDIAPGEWVEKVYKADILGRWDKLFKKPGYDPLEPLQARRDPSALNFSFRARRSVVDRSQREQAAYLVGVLALAHS